MVKWGVLKVCVESASPPCRVLVAPLGWIIFKVLHRLNSWDLLGMDALIEKEENIKETLSITEFICFYGFLEKLHEVEPCFLRWVLCVGFLLLVLQYLQVCPKQNLEVKKMHGWCLKMLVVTVRISPTRTQIEIVVPSSWSSKKAAACEISWYNCFNVAVCYVSFGLICKDKSQPNFEVLQNLEFPKFQTRGIPKIFKNRMSRDPKVVQLVN